MNARTKTVARLLRVAHTRLTGDYGLAAMLYLGDALSILVLDNSEEAVTHAASLLKKTKTVFQSAKTARAIINYRTQ